MAGRSYGVREVRPELSYLCLLRGADFAVKAAELLNLVNVRRVAIASDLRWSWRTKLSRVGDDKGCDLRPAWQIGRPEMRGSPPPLSWFAPHGVSDRHAGIVFCAPVENCLTGVSAIRKTRFASTIG